MTGRDGATYSRNAKTRRCGVIMGGAVGAFAAAAAMATGSAAPAKADIDALIDPIIQPIVTSLTDSLTAVDPVLATDLTSWTDSLLTSLNTLDLALPASAESSSALAAAAEPAASGSVTSADGATGTYDIPITIQEATEPTVTATVDGSTTTDLVDTGSSGLVVPLTDLDGGSTNLFTELETLYNLGSPTSFGESGYSGGVDYIYLTYDNATVDYTGGLDTTAPVEVEVYSYDPSDFSSFFTNDAFQTFLTDNDSTGILGIGDSTSGAAGESPLEAAGFGGVTVNEATADPELIVTGTPDTAGVDLTASGSTVDDLTETVTTASGQTVGSATVDDDLDSGGVYGTIPDTISSSDLPNGDMVTVYDNGTPLYSYTVGTDSLGDSESPTPVDSTDIDSGVIPFLEHPISIDYDNGDIYLDNLT